jgi:hypothetical protein
MTQGQSLKVLGATVTFAAVALAVMLIRSPGVQAHAGNQPQPDGPRGTTTYQPRSTLFKAKSLVSSWGR